MTRGDPAGDLPVVERGTVEAAREEGLPDATVAGVLLAAGTSERFGDRNKLLAEVDGEPMVRRAARTLLAADLDRVVAVVGHEADRLREALAPLDLSVVENPDYEAGQATSVRRAVEALRDSGGEPNAAVFALGDMPWVAPESVALVVDAFRADFGDPLAAAADGERGNPVLFGARHFDALADVAGDRGGRDILLDSPDAALVETGDPGVVRDVDRPGDLEPG